MNSISERQTGWRPIPLALKILSGVFVLWSVGAILNMPNLMENGLPLFGVFVFGPIAILVVLVLDIIGPMTFLFALWRRKPWGPKWAYTYIYWVFYSKQRCCVFYGTGPIGITTSSGAGFD